MGFAHVAKVSPKICLFGHRIIIPSGQNLLLAFDGFSRHTRRQSFLPPQGAVPDSCMFESGSLVPKTDHSFVAAPPSRGPQSANDIRQRRLMVIALTLLLAVLGLAIYAHRAMWFQDCQQADSGQPSRG